MWCLRAGVVSLASVKFVCLQPPPKPLRDPRQHMIDQQAKTAKTPATTVAAGQARHMRALLKNLGARWHATKSAEEIVRLALAAYNASSRAVRNGKVPPGGSVEAYVEKVMRIYAALRAEFVAAKMGTPDIPWKLAIAPA